MVKKLFPALITFGTKMNADYRIALGLFGLLNQRHTSLFGRTPALFDITGRTGTDDIVPSAFAAQCSRHNMIQRQFGCGKFHPAILATAAVASKNITAIEFNRLSRKTIVKQKPNDTRHGDIEMHRGNPVVLVSLKGTFGLADLPPHVKIIVGIRSIIAGDDLGLFPAQQRKRTTRTDDTKRHIVLVQHQDAAI